MTKQRKLPGRCPVCGMRDDEIITVGGVKMFCCEEHNSFWPVPAEPDTRAPGWCGGWYSGMRRKAR
jgi:hypothetical protein